MDHGSARGWPTSSPGSGDWSTTDTFTVDVTLVADGRRPAALVAGDVQRNVYQAVHRAHDIAPERIAVHVVDIALPA